MIAVFVLAWCGTVQASEYPSRPVEVYVGGAAGGALDLVMRTIAPSFEKRFGQAFIIINKPGAYGMLAANTVMESASDGYRLSTITPGALDAMRDTRDPNYDPARLTFVTGLVTFPLIIAVNGEGTVRTVADLIETKPGFWGTANTIGILGGDAFLDAAGLSPRPSRVYFRGKEQEMLLMILRNEISFAVASAPAALGLIQDGKIRPVAVIARRRSSFFPDIPTLAEALAAAHKPAPRGVREPSVGITVPMGTPAERVEALANGLRAIVAEPEIRRKLGLVLAEPTEWDGGDQ